MRQLIAEGVKVQTVVTSPPYFGLRDYGLPALVWGGDPDCAHEWGGEVVSSAASYGVNSKVRWNHRENGRGEEQAHMVDRAGWERKDVKQGQFCQLCGAWGGSLGLEPTVELYVEHIVEVFRLAREIMADDGTFWCNLGDSYASVGKWGGSSGGKNDAAKKSGAYIRERKEFGSLKSKDLIGVPWRVAFALQSDGWWLRQDIIWSKPSPMPESVRDRCTKSHEYLFLLAKSERYYYDAEAIKEESVTNDPRRPYGSPGANALDQRGEQGAGKLRAPANVKRGDFDGKTNDMPGREAFRAFTETRNKRSVWTVATQPYSEAHFATYPPALIEPCILAGSKPGDIVFDPFFGSGTTGEVAQRLGRDWIGCELNPEYGKIAEVRTSGTIGMAFV